MGDRLYGDDVGFEALDGEFCRRCYEYILRWH